jgi:protein phosphatase
MRPVLSKMVATGRVSVRTAAQDPRRNALRSALSGGEVPFIDSPPIPLVMVRGDGVILASDGLETLGSRAIASVLKGGNRSKPGAVVEALLKATRAVRKPHQDNTSVIFYRYGARGRNATNRGNDRPLKFWLVIALLLAILSMTILIYS